MGRVLSVASGLRYRRGCLADREDSAFGQVGAVARLVPGKSGIAAVLPGVATLWLSQARPEMARSRGCGSGTGTPSSPQLAPGSSRLLSGRRVRPRSRNAGSIVPGALYQLLSASMGQISTSSSPATQW